MPRLSHSFKSFSVATSCLILLAGIALAKGKPGGSGGGGEPGPQYVVVSLGSLDQDGITNAKQINNTGGVLVSRQPGGPALLLELNSLGEVQRSVELIGPSGSGQETGAVDLDDSFNVVGSAYTPLTVDFTNSQALLWRVPASGQIQQLALSGFSVAAGNFSGTRCTGMSSNGLVAGAQSEFYLDETNQPVFVRQESVVWQVDVDGEVSKVALPSAVDVDDVNADGIVTGLANGIGAAIWVLEFDPLLNILIGSSDPIPLPGLGGDIVDVYQISDGGRIAGTALTSSGEQHGVVWTVDGDGFVLDLKDLGIPSQFERSAGAGANDAGEAVGLAVRDQKVGRTISPDSTAMFSDAAGTVELSSLVVDFGGLKTLEHAADINALGWISGYGFSRTDTHAYVAIPVQ